MKSIKDNFSIQASGYARYRPGYPAPLYDWLFSQLNNQRRAWDCATGNGQVAAVLAGTFEKVYATDISMQQLAQAPSVDNIYYSMERAEESSFPDNFFDLVVVAQAVHWFDFPLFYTEVKRTMVAGGILAILGYGLLRVDPLVDDAIQHLYHDILGQYWDKERSYIDENYATLPFPFKEMETPVFTSLYEWTMEELMGYFATWSAVQHYQKSTEQNPLALFEPILKGAWGNTKLKKMIHFPVLLRAAFIEK